MLFRSVKIYRSFLRVVVQSIRYCGGQSRQFAGDGVMGVFQSDKDTENPLTSCDKAVRAARYILTLIDYCLNPQLKKHLDDVVIGCGVGICTGTVMATKAGMRGKESDDDVDNELGIVWVGSTTNYASRFCGLASPREIFIDEATYMGISLVKDQWKKQTRVKGPKLYNGYITSGYYLDLPVELTIEPIISNETNDDDNSFIQSVFEEAQRRASHLVDEMNKKSADLAMKTAALNDKEKGLISRENNLKKREQQVNNIELEKEYYANFSIIEAANNKFTREQIRSFGKDFWLNLINKLENMNTQLGKNGFLGYQHWYMLDIYLAFEMYWEYYHSLCGMLRDDFSIYESHISPILEHIYIRDTLIELLQKYVDNGRESETRDEYIKIIKKLEI